MCEDADFTGLKIHYFGKSIGPLFGHVHVLICARAGGIISVKFADILRLYAVFSRHRIPLPPKFCDTVDLLIAEALQ